MAPVIAGSDDKVAPAQSRVPTELPEWARDALKDDTLAQPWKGQSSAEKDDPNFAQGPDTVVFYDERIKVCYGEGSLAA